MTEVYRCFGKRLTRVRYFTVGGRLSLSPEELVHTPNPIDRMIARPLRIDMRKVSKVTLNSPSETKAAGGGLASHFGSVTIQQRGSRPALFIVKDPAELFQNLQRYVDL
jgi:hypothetical protein